MKVKVKQLAFESLLLLSILPLFAAQPYKPCPDKQDPGCCLQKITFDYDGRSVTIPLDYNPSNNQCAWPELWLKAHNLTDASSTTPPNTPSITSAAEPSVVVVAVSSTAASATKTASSSLTSATISQGLQATGKVQIDLVPRNKSDIEKLENPPRSGDNNGNLPWGPNNPSSVAGGGMLAFLADSLNFATVCPILLAVLILVFA